MGSTVIPRADWPRFLEAAAHALTGTEVSVSITPGARGGRTRQEGWLPLRGIDYEIGEDVIWIHTDRIAHEIVGPTELRAVEQEERLEALEVDGADARWVLRFRAPVPQG